MIKFVEPDGLFNEGEVFEFSEDDKGEMRDFLVEALRTIGASQNFIDYVSSEIDDLQVGGDFKVEHNSEEIFTVFRV